MHLHDRAGTLASCYYIVTLLTVGYQPPAVFIKPIHIQLSKMKPTIKTIVWIKIKPLIMLFRHLRLSHLLTGM